MEQLEFLDALTQFLDARSYLALCRLSRWHRDALDRPRYLAAFLRRLAPELGEEAAHPEAKKILLDWERQGQPLMEGYYSGRTFGRASAAPASYLERAYNRAWHRRCAARHPDRRFLFEPLVPWFLVARMLERAAGDAPALSKELDWETIAQCVTHGTIGYLVISPPPSMDEDAIAARDEDYLVLIRAGVEVKDNHFLGLTFQGAADTLAALKASGRDLTLTNLEYIRRVWENMWANDDERSWAAQKTAMRARFDKIAKLLE